jgi:hypothetical protein
MAGNKFFSRKPLKGSTVLISGPLRRGLAAVQAANIAATASMRAKARIATHQASRLVVGRVRSALAQINIAEPEASDSSWDDVAARVAITSRDAAHPPYDDTEKTSVGASIDHDWDMVAKRFAITQR